MTHRLHRKWWVSNISQHSTNISFLIYFGKASIASSPVTQQEQKLDSSLAPVSVGFFCCISSLFSSLLFLCFFCCFFFSASGKHQQWKKQKTTRTLFNIKYFSQAVMHNSRQKWSDMCPKHQHTHEKLSKAWAEMKCKPKSPSPSAFSGLQHISLSRVGTENTCISA